ncbi:PAS domain S-box protein [Desulfosarcina cetonica]|uniref:PAS domain S-box protein n=1 Tax=Desulfosarcina cetonica TaxID=90730 RepID=UPI0012EE4455|nr:PAS domain S-box protein [Desulfosarcina cetonica]
MTYDDKSMFEKPTYEDLKQRVRELEEAKAKQRAIENALRETIQQHCELLHDLPVLICSYLPSGEITFINDAYCNYFGKSAKALVGSNFLSLIPEVDREAVLSDITAKTPQLAVRSRDHRVIATDGATRWQQWTNRALFDGCGKPTAYQSVGIDITEQKQAEKKLQESETRFKFLSEATFEGIQIHDQGVILDANHTFATMLGYRSVDEIIGKQIMSKHLTPESFQKVQEKLASGFEGVYEVIGIKCDGERFPVEIISKNIKYHGRSVRVSAARDITDRKQAEDKLKASEQRLRLFIDHAPASLAMFDREMRYVAVSRRWMEDFRLGEQEIIGTSHYELFPELPDRLKAVHIRGLSGEVVREENDPFQRLDGNIQWLNWEVRPWYTIDGEVGGIVIFSADVTDRIQIEQALKSSESKLRSLVMTIPDLVWLKDPQGTYLACNSRFERFLGAKERDIVGKTDYDFVEKELADLFHEQDEKAIARGGPSINEEEITFADDGHREILETIKAPIYDKKGQIAGVLGIGRDITDRKRVQDEQRMMVDALQLINAADDMDTLLHTILNRLQEWSHCAAVGIRLKEGPDYPYYTTLGFSKQFVRLEKYLCNYDEHGKVERDAEGRPLLECMCGNILRGKFDPSRNFFTTDGSFWSNCTTELLATTTDADRQARTRNRCNGVGYESVALIPLRAGNQTYGLLQLNDKQKGRFTPDLIALYRRIADSIANALAKKMAEAKVLHLNNVLRGIRDVNKLLAYEKNRTRLIQGVCDLLVEARGFDAVVIALTDEKGDWTVEHAVAGQIESCLSEMLDHGEVSHCGRHAMANLGVIVRGHNEQFCNHCSNYQKSNKDQNPLIVSLSHEGRRYGFMMTFLSGGMEDHPDEDDLLVEMASDVSFALHSLEIKIERDTSMADLAKTQEQFRQAQKMEAVGRLAGGVAHDYNNMLSVILGYADLAMEKVRPQDPLYDDLNEILIAGKRSVDITRQLLAFARRQTISPKVLDLNQTVESMLKMLRRLIGEDLDMSWNPGKQLWPIKMDPSQIDQLLANLCVNARDAITDIGKITIETGKMTFDTAYCADHAGFVAGDFVMLAVSDDGCGMDKETQDKIFEPFFTTKGVGQGTGLGLATVYGIVKQNGGFINVYSEPDKGTTFKIYLPRYHGAYLEERKQGVEAIPEGRNERILIVEDEPQTLRLADKMLRGLGSDTLATSMPSEAIQLAGAHGDIALLITDIVMPEMNGRELWERIEALCPGLRCLFMSGYTADVIAHRGVLEEGVNFIQKPFSKKDLGVKVRDVFNRKLKK